MEKMHKSFYPMTMFIVAMTSIVTILQFIYPEILNIFRRDPVGLAAGEWWRVITPLLVHADGWWQYVFNIASIIIVGSEVERLYGGVKLLILYLAGGLIGEIVGYASWDPYGAGASVGLCGLIGGLFVVMLSRERKIHIAPAMLSLYIIVGLVGIASEEIYVLIGLFIVASIVMAIIIRQKLAKLSDILFGLGGLLGGVTLLVFRDIHGAAILGGSVTAIILILVYRNRN
ncbi:rhomboid family intramembrane serine protease [Virgibacillus soli]|uniref:Rhomboid family intramembrane serine protease n=1 Tax=Paracerasibacillus soli TaxID=480284 RepID=A0ABU5CV88_9BACI|nr:rhomboid family intramembrane serine protease [Virgibacillus soli]MDY0410150.1 rhomboid family intramembrane serine protease [Virgibacillus soli]